MSKKKSYSRVSAKQDNGTARYSVGRKKKIKPQQGKCARKKITAQQGKCARKKIRAWQGKCAEKINYGTAG